MQSNANSVDAYINELPFERKEAITKLREEICRNIPKGFKECINYGMIGYVVPHEIYPKGYHCTPELPLPFLNIASHKNYITVYNMAFHDEILTNWFLAEYAKISSKKLDIGKCCIRFKNISDIPYSLIGQLATKITPEEWIKIYEKSLDKKK